MTNDEIRMEQESKLSSIYSGCIQNTETEARRRNNKQQ